MRVDRPRSAGRRGRVYEIQRRGVGSAIFGNWPALDNLCQQTIPGQFPKIAAPTPAFARRHHIWPTRLLKYLSGLSLIAFLIYWPHSSGLSAPGSGPRIFDFGGRRREVSQSVGPAKIENSQTRPLGCGILASRSPVLPHHVVFQQRGSLAKHVRN